MLDLHGIKKSMDKLKKQKNGKQGHGEIEYIESGRRERRYSYYYKGKMVFTFGLTKSPRAKSKTFGYVPEQMGIKRKQYRKLHDCTWYQDDYNMELIKLGRI